MELLILPLILALLSYIIPSKGVRYYGLGASLLILAVTLGHLLQFNVENYIAISNPKNDLPFGLTFKLGYDSLSFILVLLINSVVPLILLSNFNKELASNKSFTALVFFMQMGLTGVFLAQDGMLFYIFWEITLIPIFLILFWYGEQNNNKVLLKFFIYTLLGSLAMLLAIVVLGITAHSFDYETLAIYGAIAPAKTACWISCGFLLAFAIKIPLFPFHTWQPATYTSAPMAGTMLLSALMLKMALYGMIKWMIPLGFTGIESIKWLVITLGLIGVIYGAVIAIKQNDIKTLFAYASISHVGLIAAGIMVYSTTAVEVAIIQMINHSIVAVGLFLAADILESRTNTRDLYALGGIAKLAPNFGFWFASITFVSISVPFTAGFFGEFLLIKELFEAHWLAGFSAATTLVFGAVYMLRAFQLSMFGAPKLESFIDLKWNEILVFAILVGTAIFLGLFPQFVIDFVKPSIAKIQELTSYDLKIIK